MEFPCALGLLCRLKLLLFLLGFTLSILLMVISFFKK